MDYNEDRQVSYYESDEVPEDSGFELASRLVDSGQNAFIYLNTIGKHFDLQSKGVCFIFPHFMKSRLY